MKIISLCIGSIALAMTAASFAQTGAISKPYPMKAWSETGSGHSYPGWKKMEKGEWEKPSLEHSIEKKMEKRGWMMGSGATLSGSLMYPRCARPFGTGSVDASGATLSGNTLPACRFGEDGKPGRGPRMMIGTGVAFSGSLVHPGCLRPFGTGALNASGATLSGNTLPACPFGEDRKPGRGPKMMPPGLMKRNPMELKKEVETKGEMGRKKGQEQARKNSQKKLEDKIQSMKLSPEKRQDVIKKVAENIDVLLASMSGSTQDQKKIDALNAMKEKIQAELLNK